jgi:hypothetical protein
MLGFHQLESIIIIIDVVFSCSCKLLEVDHQSSLVSLSFPNIGMLTCLAGLNEFQEKTWWNWENLDSFNAKQTIPQTVIGEQVEYTKAFEKTMLKELDKMTS